MSTSDLCCPAEGRRKPPAGGTQPARGAPNAVSVGVIQRITRGGKAHREDMAGTERLKPPAMFVPIEEESVSEKESRCQTKRSMSCGAENRSPMSALKPQRPTATSARCSFPLTLCSLSKPSGPPGIGCMRSMPVR